MAILRQSGSGDMSSGLSWVLNLMTKVYAMPCFALAAMYILPLKYHFKMEMFLVWLSLYDFHDYHYRVSFSTFYLSYKEYFQSTQDVNI